MSRGRASPAAGSVTATLTLSGARPIGLRRCRPPPPSRRNGGRCPRQAPWHGFARRSRPRLPPAIPPPPPPDSAVPRRTTPGPSRLCRASQSGPGHLPATARQRSSTTARGGAARPPRAAPRVCWRHGTREAIEMPAVRRPGPRRPASWGLFSDSSFIGPGPTVTGGQPLAGQRRCSPLSCLCGARRLQVLLVSGGLPYRSSSELTTGPG